MQEPSWVLTLRGQGKLQSCCAGSRAHWSDLDVDLPPGCPAPSREQVRHCVLAQSSCAGVFAAVPAGAPQVMQSQPSPRKARR